jgi:hypothetical protein
MTLANELREYYFDNLEDLSLPRKFHFASRLAAWEDSSEAFKIIQGLKDHMVPKNNTSKLSEIMKKPLGKIFAADFRRPFLKKYPNLYGTTAALFRIRHLKEIYGMDIRADFLKLVKTSELDRMHDSILSDPEALRTLSSLAVNYLYLKEQLFGGSNLNPSIIMAQKDSYDFNDPIQTNLYVYLLTHCIIADSNFYVRNVPSERLPIYSAMVEDLSATIKKYDGIRLDAKFEYLVSSRICGRESPLTDQVDKLAVSSITLRGKFITERLVSNLREINSLGGSEHRNVLYIMSKSPFKPKDISKSVPRLRTRPIALIPID